LRQRFYAAVEGTILSFILITFIVGTAINPSYVRERNARYLQAALNRDDRFSHVRVKYVELKLDFLQVDGTVESDRDFQALRTAILSYDWRNEPRFGIYWDVTVASSSKKYDGFDEGLFGKGN
jgi:hypothetical protein